MIRKIRTKSAAIATLGIDIGKNTFHLIGLDKRGARHCAETNLDARHTISEQSLMKPRTLPLHRAAVKVRRFHLEGVAR